MQSFGDLEYTISRLGLILARVELHEKDSPDVAILKDEIRALLLRKQDVDEITSNPHKASPAKIAMALLAQCGTRKHVGQLYERIANRWRDERIPGWCAIHFSQCEDCRLGTVEQLRPYI